MSNRSLTPSESLPVEIRRQFGSTAMTRYVRSLPTLGEPLDTDDRFAAMLIELEQAERRLMRRSQANMTEN